MSDISTVFESAVQSWLRYCKDECGRFDSGMPLLKSPARSEIISLGYGALPLLRRLYDLDPQNDEELFMIQHFGLSSIVGGIVGDDFSVPQEMQGRIFEVKEYTKRWLDVNMNKYQ